MYDNKFVVCIKHDNKILREFKDVAYLPFGSEYSVLLKNLNNRRALVQLTIDGIDIGDGTKFVIDANSELEVKRFIKNGNLTEGNALKFIERTSQIEEHRGIKSEDGLVRVEFQFEKEVVHHHDVKHVYHHYYDCYPYYNYRPWYWSPGVLGGYSGTTLLNNAITSNNISSYNATATGSSQDYSTNIDGFNQVNAESSSTTTPVNDAGITVPGSAVKQEFKQIFDFDAELATHVIILRLVGETIENKVITQPVTVKTKHICSTCGKSNKATSNFCNSCGTALQII
jgi:hypothetical protein